MSSLDNSIPSKASLRNANERPADKWTPLYSQSQLQGRSLVAFLSWINLVYVLLEPGLIHEEKSPASYYIICMYNICYLGPR